MTESWDTIPKNNESTYLKDIELHYPNSMTFFLKRMVKLLIWRNDCGSMKSSHIKNIQNPRIRIHFTIILPQTSWLCQESFGNKLNINSMACQLFAMVATIWKSIYHGSYFCISIPHSQPHTIERHLKILYYYMAFILNYDD